jgi:hypothetical protein
LSGARFVFDGARLVCIWSINATVSWAAMPGANFHGGFLIWRQVDVLAMSRIETACEDRIEVATRRAMKQRSWWLNGRQAQINDNGMSLGGSYTAAVLRECESLLVVVCDDLSEGIGGKSVTRPFHAAQELVPLDPSAGAKRQPDQVGLMAKDARQELTLFGHLKCVS